MPVVNIQSINQIDQSINHRAYNNIQQTFALPPGSGHWPPPRDRCAERRCGYKYVCTARAHNYLKEEVWIPVHRIRLATPMA